MNPKGKFAVGASIAALCIASAGVQSSYAAPTSASSAVASASLAPTQQMVSGTVLDANGDPVIGAAVKVRGTQIGTVTDIDGKFHMQVPVGSELEVTYVGMLPQTIKVTAGVTTYDFNLKEDTNTLDEVVVVGYGQQKKVNLTGSVSSVNVDKISEGRPLNNVSQALAGLAAGVNVQSTSNQPGDDNAKIRVRGQGTLNTSSPLIIVDGVEAGINTVMPQDIESMSVLKDAASAAIYGSRAANGVILITTKKGKAGSLKLEYNGYVSFESIRKTLTPVSNYANYMELINEGYVNSGLNAPFSTDVIKEWRDNEGKDELRYPNQNWIDATFKNATATNHVLAMSGGTDKIRFYGSFGFSDNPGVMPNAGYKRYSARVSVDADVKPWLSLGIFANGYRSDLERGASQVSNIFTYASATTPGMVFIAPDGRYGAMNNLEDDPQSATNNPYTRAYSQDGGTRVNNARFRFTGTLRPYKGVSVIGSYSYDFSDSQTKSKPHFLQAWNFKDDQITRDTTGKTSVSYSNSKTERYFWDVVAHYDAKFLDRLGLNVMVGASSELYRSGSFSASRQDLVDLSLWALNAATGDANASGSSTEWSMQSYFGRVNLNWDDKYLAEFNLRFDGSSRFQPGRRWGHFPSGSIGWRLDQESFMESLVDKGLNSLKLRASYGELGNNSIGNYASQALYTNSGMSYVLGNSLATGMAMSALANSMVTWESTRVFDVGFDLGLFNNRLQATIDYFDKKTKNILISLPAPAVHGTTSLPTVNSAQVSNKGIELSLAWNDRIDDFSYGVNFNFTYVKNNVDKFKGKGKDGMSISGANLIWEGHSINSQYLLLVDRIIQTDEDLALVQSMIDNAPIDEATGKQKNPFASYGTPEKGDFLYKDANGDGVIDQNDRVIVSDGAEPKYYLGATLNASWKGIDFSMLLQAQLGCKRYWLSDFNRPTVRWGYQLNQEVCDGRWYEGRTDATYPRLLMYSNTVNTQASDFYLQDLAFLKIRNIQLGYTLPSSWVKSCSLERVRIYGALENFFTFTKFKGFDPEVSGMAYPTMRQAVVGLNVTF